MTPTIRGTPPIITSVTTYYVKNFGCRAAQADGAAIEQQLRCRGLQPASRQDSADVVVLNTCTVTAAADQDARQPRGPELALARPGRERAALLGRRAARRRGP